MQRAGQERVSRHRADGQRHRADDAQPGGMAAQPEVRRLLGVPSARQQGDARDPRRARQLPLVRARVGSPHSVGSGRRQHDQRAQRARASERALALFADWTDRIAKGEVPPAPPRPQGIERNVVITMWDWADPMAYLHDVVSTDRRNPTVNANGPVYGALELSARLPAGARSRPARQEPGAADRARSRLRRRPRRRCRSRRRIGAAR